MSEDTVYYLYGIALGPLMCTLLIIIRTLNEILGELRAMRKMN